MVLGHKVLLSGILLLFGLTLFAQIAGTGDSVLPLDVLRPQYGEELRFPTDYVIGELGRGDASEESYQLARRLLVSLAAGKGTADNLFFPEQKRLSALSSLNALGVRTWRLGGGRVEPDGSFSYLVRFLGRERSITGELFLQRVESAPEKATETAAFEAPAGPEADVTDSPEADVTVPAVPVVPAAAPAATVIMAWQVDDLLLESPRSLAEGKYSPGGADMTPYERFF